MNPNKILDVLLEMTIRIIGLVGVLAALTAAFRGLLFVITLCFPEAKKLL